MDLYQLFAFIILLLFYTIYFTKMLFQSRKGIKTNQMAVGKKSKKTFRVEMLLRTFTLIIVAVELISIILNTSSISSAVIRLIGLVLGLLGVLVFFLAVYTMKDSWRAGIPSEDKTCLVTNGIYRISRNPAFLGFDFIYLGLLLSFSNIVHVIIALLTIIMLHLQILQEEKFLIDTFGEKYIEYRKKVGRYFIFF